MLREIDFTISSIQHIINRMPDPNWKIDITANETFFVIGFALDGQAEYKVNNIRYSIHKNGLILLPPGTPRRAYSVPGNPWHFISIACELDFGDEASRQTMLGLPIHFTRMPDAFALKCLELVHIWDGKQNGYLLKSKSLLLELFYILLQYHDRQQFPSTHYEKIKQAQDYISCNYTKDIQPSDLAKFCGYSESYFRKLFHDIIGMGCVQYINLVKIEAAKNLLISGTANVSEAATLTGFSDIYYFSRIFKKITGHPPSSYKKS